MAHSSVIPRIKILLLSGLLFSTCILSSQGDDNEDDKTDTGTGVDPGTGGGETKSSLEDMKKIKCLYRKIVTCGISDDETECIDTKDLQVIEEISNLSPEQMLASDKFAKPSETMAKLKDFRSEAKKMCSIALGLQCHEKRCNDKKKCDEWEFGCRDNEPRLKKISQASDWKEDNNDCGKPDGEDYTKCPVELKIKPESSLDDVNKIKCLYKKIVTCGLTDDEDDPHCVDHDLEEVKWLDENIAWVSPEDLKSKTYKKAEDAKAAIKRLEEFESKSQGMCSISKDLFCKSGKCQENCDYSHPVCTHLSSISRASDWQRDYNCGNTANCKEKPDKPLSSKDAKYFKEKLELMFKGIDSWRCKVELSSNKLIEYYDILQKSEEEILTWLKEDKRLETHLQVKKFTAEVTTVPGEVCSAQKNFVCIPNRINLNTWSDDGTCMSCSEVQEDMGFDFKFRSLCRRFITPLQQKQNGDEAESSRGNPNAVRIGTFYVLFFMRGRYSSYLLPAIPGDLNLTVDITVNRSVLYPNLLCIAFTSQPINKSDTAV